MTKVSLLNFKFQRLNRCDCLSEIPKLTEDENKAAITELNRLESQLDPWVKSIRQRKKSNFIWSIAIIALTGSFLLFILVFAYVEIWLSEYIGYYAILITLVLFFVFMLGLYYGINILNSRLTSNLSRGEDELLLTIMKAKELLQQESRLRSNNWQKKVKQLLERAEYQIKNLKSKRLWYFEEYNKLVDVLLADFETRIIQVAENGNDQELLDVLGWLHKFSVYLVKPNRALFILVLKELTLLNAWTVPKVSYTAKIMLWSKRRSWVVTALIVVSGIVIGFIIFVIDMNDFAAQSSAAFGLSVSVTAIIVIGLVSTQLILRKRE